MTQFKIHFAYHKLYVCYVKNIWENIWKNQSYIFFSISVIHVFDPLLLSERSNIKTRRLSRDNSSSPHDLDLWPIQMKPSNFTSTHDGEQLCKFILKSTQNCRSYGSNKNLTFRPSSVILTLGLPEQMIQMAHLHVMENYSLLCQIILKSIHSCRSYGLDKFGSTHKQMHAHTWNCCCNKYASLITSGPDKNNHVFNFCSLG